MMFSSTRSYFRRLAQGYEKDTLSHFLYPVLEVVSRIYCVVVRMVRVLHEAKILPRKRLQFPVISVGNLAWGGTGKTPFVEYLARRVSERRRTPLILTRGYSHDEVEQLRHHLPKAVIGVGKKRWNVAQDMAKKHRIDVAILDDGLQHWRIERDIEIIMINALDPFGNGKILPRGILREPLSILKRAAIIVISHTNLVSIQKLRELKEKLKEIAPESFIVDSYLEPLFFYRAKRRSRVSLDRLRNQRVTTFSAVGAPRSFQLLLSHFSIKPVRNFEFTDHHVFSEGELQEIRQVSDSASVDEIVTTEKDFYRSASVITNSLNPLILATRLRISSGEEILTDRLFRLLGVMPR